MVADLGDGFQPARVVDREEFGEVGWFDIEARGVERVGGGEVADRGLVGGGGAVEAFEDPFEDTAVFAVARPHEVALFVTAEPIDEEDLGEFFFIGFCSYLEPMLEVVGHVVAAEGEHGHWVEAEFAHLAAGGCCCFGGHDGAEEDTVVPVEGLGHQWDSGAAAAAEEDGGDGNAGWVLPLGGNAWALAGRGGEAGVGVCCGGFGFWSPGLVFPVGDTGGGFLGHAFPPHVAIFGDGGVGEDGVAPHGVHGIDVGFVAGEWGDAEEAGFGVDGVELAVGAVLHPADVVTNGFGFPAWDGGHEHGEVGFAASRREGGGDVFEFALWVGEFQDEHVLGKPAVVAGHDGSNAKSETLFAEECVAAVARAEALDFAGFGEVHDVFVVGVAWPGDILLAGCKWCADGVHAGNPLVVAECVECALAHAGHDAHADGNVGAVGELHADVGDGGTEWAHAEWNDVHHAAAHGACVELLHFGAHLVGVAPVVVGACIDFVF